MWSESVHGSQPCFYSGFEQFDVTFADQAQYQQDSFTPLLPLLSCDSISRDDFSCSLNILFHSLVSSSSTPGMDFSLHNNSPEEKSCSLLFPVTSEVTEPNNAKGIVQKLTNEIKLPGSLPASSLMSSSFVHSDSGNMSICTDANLCWAHTAVTNETANCVTQNQESVQDHHECSPFVQACSQSVEPCYDNVCFLGSDNDNWQHMSRMDGVPDVQPTCPRELSAVVCWNSGTSNISDKTVCQIEDSYSVPICDVDDASPTSIPQCPTACFLPMPCSELEMSGRETDVLYDYFHRCIAETGKHGWENKILNWLNLPTSCLSGSHDTASSQNAVLRSQAYQDAHTYLSRCMLDCTSRQTVAAVKCSASDHNPIQVSPPSIVRGHPVSLGGCQNANPSTSRSKRKRAECSPDLLHQITTFDNNDERNIPGVYFDKRKRGFRVRFQNVYVGWVSLSQYSTYEEAYTVAKSIWNAAVQEVKEKQDKRAAVNAGASLLIQSKLKTKNPGGRPRTVSKFSPSIDAQVVAAVKHARLE